MKANESTEMKVRHDELKLAILAIQGGMKAIDERLKVSEGKMDDVLNKEEPKYVFRFALVAIICSVIGTFATVFMAMYPYLKA